MSDLPPDPFDDPTMGRRFAGKTAVVTGAAGGIGRATARRLAAEGASVWCVDLDGDGVQLTAADIREHGAEARGGPLDVTDAEACRTLIGDIVAHAGALHVVCNVAGIGGSSRTTDETPERFAAMLAVNAAGPFHLIQAALPHLLEVRGAVVNVASIAGVMGQAYLASYCASKHALVGLTKALAIEYGREGVRFNAVCPGGVNTPILANFSPPEGASMSLVSRGFLSREMQEPGSVAAMCAYAASDEAAFVNGAVLVVDGGTTAG